MAYEGYTIDVVGNQGELVWLNGQGKKEIQVYTVRLILEFLNTGAWTELVDQPKEIIKLTCINK